MVIDSKNFIDRVNIRTMKKDIKLAREKNVFKKTQAVAKTEATARAEAVVKNKIVAPLPPKAHVKIDEIKQSFGLEPFDLNINSQKTGAPPLIQKEEIKSKPSPLGENLLGRSRTGEAEAIKKPEESLVLHKTPKQSESKPAMGPAATIKEIPIKEPSMPPKETFATQAKKEEQKKGFMEDIKTPLPIKETLVPPEKKEEQERKKFMEDIEDPLPLKEKSMEPGKKEEGQRRKFMEDIEHWAKEEQNKNK